MENTYNLGFTLHHLAFVFSRQSDQILQEQLGLGFSQYKLLMILHKHPHIQQKTIAEKLGQTEASISRQIKLMIHDGLLTTTKRAENRREHITTLTPNGERLTEQAVEILTRYHEPIFNRLSPQQREALIDALEILHTEACSCDKLTNQHITAQTKTN